MTNIFYFFFSFARFTLQQFLMQLTDWSLLKSTDGIPRSQRTNRTCRRTKLISTLAARWFLMLWLKSRTKSTQLWPSVGRVVRVFVALVQWTSAAQTLWLVSARSIQLTWTSRLKSIRCLTCMSSRISFLTWTTSTISIVLSSHGYSASRFILLARTTWN